MIVLVVPSVQEVEVEPQYHVIEHYVASQYHVTEELSCLSGVKEWALVSRKVEAWL
jgi:hypothetical protein